MIVARVAAQITPRRPILKNPDKQKLSPTIRPIARLIIAFGIRVT